MSSIDKHPTTGPATAAAATSSNPGAKIKTRIVHKNPDTGCTKVELDLGHTKVDGYVFHQATVDRLMQAGAR